MTNVVRFGRGRNGLSDQDIAGLTALAACLCGAWDCEISTDDDGARRVFLVARDWGDGREAAFVVFRERKHLTLADHRKTPAFGNAKWTAELAERQFPALEHLANYVEMQVGSRRLMPPAGGMAEQPGD
jgi:hypothetical protein